MHAKLLQLCSTLCDPMDYSAPGSSVHGILHTRILEWVAMPSSRGSSQPRDRTHVSKVWEYISLKYGNAAAKLLQSCLTLCDPIDSSPPGSSIPGILQARTLEWVAISFSNARMQAKLFQSCLTLYDPMDNSPPISSVHGILHTRILEWAAISFSF